MTFWKKIFQKENESPAADVARAQQHDTLGTSPTGTARSTSAISASGRGSGTIQGADAFFVPVTSEKASMLNAKGQYVFRVAAGANKPAVERAVSRRYGVAVSAVRMLVMPGKERRRGRITGWKPGFKKAIVTLKKGQTIEVQ